MSSSEHNDRPGKSGFFARRVTLWAALGTAVACCFAAGRLLYAEIFFVSGDRSSVARAVALVPSNAEWQTRLAQLTPDRSIAIYRASLELNPRQTGSWIELAGVHELEANEAAAEACLRRAATLSRHDLPRFALANFYFRNQRPELFARAARTALETTSSDPQPVFDMARGIGFRDDFIGSNVVPDRPRILTAWLDAAASRGNAEEAGRTARRLAQHGSSQDVAAVLRGCNALLDAGRVQDALAVWNSLAERRWIPYGPASQEGGVTNGSFSAPPLRAGFDWRIGKANGMTSMVRQGLRVEFDGTQPQHVDIAHQIVPVEPRRRHRLEVRYRTEGLPAESGLRWQAAVREGGTLRTLAQSASLSSESADATAALDFTVPPEFRAVHVGVTYDRLPGTVRSRGTLTVEHVRLSVH